jgi:hypothetical protein
MSESTSLFGMLFPYNGPSYRDIANRGFITIKLAT